MEIRELVRLKRGMGGLEPPFNIGIILSREKGGKDHVARVFTLKGEMTVKWRTIKEAGGAIFTGDKKDINSMKGFIKMFVETEKKENRLKMEPQQIIDKYTSKDLWESVMRRYENGKMEIANGSIDIPPWCEPLIVHSAEIARIHFYPMTLTPDQEGAIKKILKGTDEIGEPYFHRIDMKRISFYLPHKRSALDRVKEHIIKLEGLRSAFLEVREEEEEAGRIKRNPVPLYDDPKDAVLDNVELEELERICNWARTFMQEGGWKRTGDHLFGLADTPIKRFGTFDLEKFVSSFSHHLIMSRKWNLPSDLIGMLIMLGKISKKDASELVVEFDLGSGRSKFHGKFPDHVINAAKRLPTEVTNDDVKGRMDLRHLLTYTIDPPDAKDFDDAISIEKDEENWTVWVHIADVSQYVRPGDLIDGEARYRGTSVYLPTGVLPMLPRELSENLCSLREKVDRLAMTTKIGLSPDMEVISKEHFRSMIRVDKNLSYDQVDPWIEERVEPFIWLHEISEGLSKRYGRLSLETPERKIRFLGDNDIDIKVKRPTNATKAIEQLMVLTNESAASTLRDNGYALPYRVHPMPDRASVEKFNNICEALNLEFNLEVTRSDENVLDDVSDGGNEDSLVRALLSGGKIGFGGLGVVREDRTVEDTGAGVARSAPIPIDDIRNTVASYNSVLRGIDDLVETPLNGLLRIWMLRTMPRAFYSEDNIGHFGLGSNCYCHFTSPIRRYPDILVHRSIAHLIDSKQEECGFISDPPTEEEMIDILEHVNDMSDEAEKWERTMIDVALATRAFVDPDIKKGSHSGLITSIIPSSIFVQLEDGVTEGRMPIRMLSDLKLDVDDSGTKVIMSIDSNTDRGIDDPLITRALKEGVDEIDVLRLGERRKFHIFNISLAEGKIELSLSETL